MIEGMKTQRFTLEEIRERLNLLDGHLPEKGKEISRGTLFKWLSPVQGIHGGCHRGAGTHC
ncbi:hypothetical protein DCCM_4088 [Desulfocucumis palustris]|uniref:Uncharacterized protein n=1 Tax=Desulfocucumis palustris TaxID=1898651 RepID=A0A2L2XF50_9FIRM|nr:hypothetical protein DCCM_4088 [Desulfocucumis palustris]